MGAVVLSLALFGVARWSLIPLRLDTAVDRVVDQDSTTGHFDMIFLADGQKLIVHREITELTGGAKALRRASIHKERWDRTVRVNGQAVNLPIPVDLWRTLASASFLVGFGWWLRYGHRNERSGE